MAGVLYFWISARNSLYLTTKLRCLHNAKIGRFSWPQLPWYYRSYPSWFSDSFSSYFICSSSSYFTIIIMFSSFMCIPFLHANIFFFHVLLNLSQNPLYLSVMSVLFLQENVLAESQMMIPDCKKRLEAALADIQNLLVSKRNLDMCHPFPWSFFPYVCIDQPYHCFEISWALLTSCDYNHQYLYHIWFFYIIYWRSSSRYRHTCVLIFFGAFSLLMIIFLW